MADFPLSVFTKTNPVSTDTLASPSHSGQHSTINNEVEAVQSYLLGSLSVSPSAYGTVGDGVTDDTTAMQAALDAGVPLVIRHNHLVSALNIPGGSRISFEGGTLTASGTGVVATITGADVVIRNLSVNLNSQSYRALYGLLHDSIRILGSTYIRNAKTGGANYNGGVLFQSCDDVHIENVLVEDFYQVNSSTEGLYRAVELWDCDNFSVGTIVQRRGDIALNLFATTNGSVGSVHSATSTNNAVYISDACVDISINSIYAKAVGVAGLVLGSTSDDARISIGTVFVDSAVGYGIALRTGGGYTIGTATLIESRMVQDATWLPVGLHHLTIGTLNIYQPTMGATQQPFWLEQNTHIRIGQAVIASDTASDAVVLQDCDYVDMALTIQGLDGSAMTRGVLIDDDTAPVTNPHITISPYRIQNVTTPYALSIASSDVNVAVEPGNERMRDLTIKQDGPVTLQLERTEITLTAGDVIAAYKVRGNDSSSVGTKLTIETQAFGGVGGNGITVFKGEAGNIIGRIGPSTVDGFSIKLPTASTGLTTGMLWNNAGTITIVP